MGSGFIELNQLFRQSHHRNSTEEHTSPNERNVLSDCPCRLHAQASVVPVWGNFTDDKFKEINSPHPSTPKPSERFDDYMIKSLWVGVK